MSEYLLSKCMTLGLIPTLGYKNQTQFYILLWLYFFYWSSPQNSPNMSFPPSVSNLIFNDPNMSYHFVKLPSARPVWFLKWALVTVVFILSGTLTVTPFPPWSISSSAFHDTNTHCFPFISHYRPNFYIFISFSGTAPEPSTWYFLWQSYPFLWLHRWSPM